MRPEVEDLRRQVQEDGVTTMIAESRLSGFRAARGFRQQLNRSAQPLRCANDPGLMIFVRLQILSQHLIFTPENFNLCRFLHVLPPMSVDRAGRQVFRRGQALQDASTQR
jgi:hypothetical protein